MHKDFFIIFCLIFNISLWISSLGNHRMLFVEYAFEISNSVEVSVRGSMEVDDIYEYKPRGLQEGRSGLLLPMSVLTSCLPTHFLSLPIHTSFLRNRSPSYIISALTVVISLNFMSWTIDRP